MASGFHKEARVSQSFDASALPARDDLDVSFGHAAVVGVGNSLHPQLPASHLGPKTAAGVDDEDIRVVQGAQRFPVLIGERGDYSRPNGLVRGIDSSRR